MADQTALCPECEAEMRPIKLIDSTGEYHNHQELGYAAGNAERGWFNGQFPESGKVRAKMCPNCGRIILRGHG